jgi:hypothetical protein
MYLERTLIFVSALALAGLSPVQASLSGTAGESHHSQCIALPSSIAATLSGPTPVDSVLMAGYFVGRNLGLTTSSNPVALGASAVPARPCQDMLTELEDALTGKS